MRIEPNLITKMTYTITGIVHLKRTTTGGLITQILTVYVRYASIFSILKVR